MKSVWKYTPDDSGAKRCPFIAKSDVGRTKCWLSVAFNYGLTRDIANPEALRTIREADSYFKYIFRNPNVTPKVSQTIIIDGTTRTIRKTERANTPDQGAIVQAY